MSRFIYGVIDGVVPTGGGWKFPLPEEFSSKLADPYLRATTFKGLIAAVRIFRIEAGIKLGDVEFDVAEYIKSVSPENDRHKGKRKFEPRPEGSPDYRPPIERAKEWVLVIGRKRDVRLVLASEAVERSEVCIKCPHNIRWKTDCLPCNEQVEYRMQNVRQRPNYHLDPVLGFCRLHDVLIGAAVFVDQDYLPDRNNEAPVECWIPKK